MTRIVPIIILALALVTGFQGFAQQGEQKEVKKTFNELYQPLPVILRLSYENFRNIKLLNSAIVNFGGGDEEFDRLVDEYAEASSLYFRNEYVLSANKFTENERNINKTADAIARKYKTSAEDLMQKTIKMKTRASFRLAMSSRRLDTHPQADEAIKDGGFSLNKANDLLVRNRPIDSIYFYRRAKEKNFYVYKVLTSQFEERRKEAQYSGKKADAEFFEKESKKYSLPDEYKKDIVDNQNRVYESSERQKDK